MQQDGSPTLEDLARWHDEEALVYKRAMDLSVGMQSATNNLGREVARHRDYAALIRRTMRETDELEEALKKLQKTVDDMPGGFW